ncbi:MAG: hypothetical protein PHV59_12920 [Victivallales bacterium]|nr:hypothetical protein [Victivallales bacterium]
MWDKSKLFNKREKNVSVCGDEFSIRKIKVVDFTGGDEKDDKKKTCQLISLSLLEPALTPDEVAGLDLDIYLGLQDAVMEFNGLGKKAKEAIQGN